MTRKEQKRTISQILEEATLIVEKFENEDPALEQMIEDYEKGVKLIREAQERLAAAELKVRELSSKSAPPESNDN